MKLLSVIIPSYNHATFVGEAISSVFAQAYRPLELVIVDDGSSDNSRAVIRQTIANAPLENVVLIEQTNRGGHAAIMRGIEASNGHYLGVLNSDDSYLPERFSTIIPLLEAAGESIAFSGLNFIDDQSNPIPRLHSWPEWYAKCLDQVSSCPTIGFSLLLQNISVTSGNLVFTRALYEKLKGFSEHKFVHDWDFLIRSVFYSEPVRVPNDLISYRVHEANTTESVRDLLFEESKDALGRYADMCRGETPPNLLAPCTEHWPVFFERFVSRHRPFFCDDKTITQVMDRW